MTEFEYSAINPQDISFLADAERQTNPLGWSAQNIRDSLQLGAQSLCVRTLNKKTPFAYLLWRRLDQEAELLNIVVAQPMQRRGIGHELVTRLGEDMDFHSAHCFLEVRESNTAAQRLYQKHRFCIVGQRKKYYKTTASLKETALIMQRKPIS